MNDTETNKLAEVDAARMAGDPRRKWTTPILQPSDLQPTGGSIQGVSDASVFTS